jgi:polysaccharide biosynthesis/export protein PslD
VFKCLGVRPPAMVGALVSITLGCFLISHARDATAVAEADASQQIERTIMDGIANDLRSYRLSPGDTVEVLFHFSGQPEADQYLIAVGDQLDLDFVYQQELNRSVNVRPDGRITLPRLGEMMASGHTPIELGKMIAEQYASILKKPVVNVEVKKYHLRSQEMRDAVEVYQRGQAKRAAILPDGRIALPLIPPVMAAGKSLEDLAGEINALYQEDFRNLKISLMLDSLAGNRVFVFGEVRNPGPIVMNGPMTVLQAVAQAGGNLETGSLEEVRVVYADQSGQTRVKTVNLAGLASQDTLSEDQLLPTNATIYLPPTSAARMGRNIDQIVRRIFMFTGFGVGFNYGKQTTR